MKRLAIRLSGVALAMVSCASIAATTLDYIVTSEASDQGRPAVRSDFRASITIDGPRFRIRNRGLESSDDDGATTWFGDDRVTKQTPLARSDESAEAGAPIVGRLEDESLVVGPSKPGPERFGLPTRIYTVDYDYLIAGRALGIELRPSRIHAHYTITAVEVGVSNAAVRVLLSRGYNHTLAQRADAFLGLPVRIEAVIDGAASHVEYTLDATSLTL